MTALGKAITKDLALGYNGLNGEALNWVEMSRSFFSEGNLAMENGDLI